LGVGLARILREPALSWRRGQASAEVVVHDKPLRTSRLRFGLVWAWAAKRLFARRGRVL